MGTFVVRHDTDSKTTNGGVTSPKPSASAAVLFALYGVPHAVIAQTQTASSQQQADSESSSLQEVIVTATRREASLESVPYSLSVVSADELARTGVTDIASLASQ